MSRDSPRVVGRQMKCYNGGNRLALGSQGYFALKRIHVYSIYEVLENQKMSGLRKNAFKKHLISDFVHSEALVVQRPVAAR